MSECKTNLMLLDINLTLNEIKQMPVRKFKNVLKCQIKDKAFSYLLNRRKTKGGQIQYNKFQTVEYLMPNQIIKSIKDKKFLFACRN